MRIITREHLEQWAKRFDSKGNLPILISRLVRATTSQGTRADFPSGSAAFVGGYDGVVQADGKTGYVPEGISVWEFGTEKDVSGKADEDYDKRSADPAPYNPKDCTFIFVTPRFFKSKDTWAMAKKAQGIWKDVIAYDSRSLEEWLDTALSVAWWFSANTNGYPFQGIQTADEFWNEWASIPNGPLLPESITSGREYEQNQLLEFLKGTASIQGVKSSTKNESIAFIIATAKLFLQHESERFFAKSLIIDTEHNFRGIRLNSLSKLNFIIRFDEMQPLHLAASQGHHVLVPLGADDSFNFPTVELPIIGRDGQVAALVNMGLTREIAERFSRESGRNITVLKKLLGAPSKQAEWVQSKDVNEIIPAILIGRWAEKFKGDVEILELLSGMPYNKYQVILQKWKNVPNSPLLQIGDTWRLTSPLDAWTTLSTYLTAIDFQRLRETFLSVFKSGNPTIKSDSKVKPSYFISAEYKYSGWLREGLAQSLIMVACYGDKLKIQPLQNSQFWVDEVIESLLSKASKEIWVSLDRELPLIAEASPDSFTKALLVVLKTDDLTILEMFKETEGLITPSSNYTGLLWALEGLAWLPENLNDVTEILLILSRIDPGGTLSNRPINSLREIFKPWHFQTFASYDDRMQVLENLSKKEPDYVWGLLLSMLPQHNGVAYPTHKLRWRLFSNLTRIVYYNIEIAKTHSYILQLLQQLFDGSEGKFAQLVDSSTRLMPNDRENLLTWMENISSSVQQQNYEAWGAIRKILNYERSFPDSRHLDDKTIARYDRLYKLLAPTDVLTRNLWLFEESWPEFPEGFAQDNDADDPKYDKQQLQVDNARQLAVQELLSEYGISYVISLASTIKQPFALGDALAKVVNDQDDIVAISKLLDDNVQKLMFPFAFFSRKEILFGLEWIKSHYAKLLSLGFNPRTLGNLFIPLRQTPELWAFIETTDPETISQYWINVQPRFFWNTVEEKIYGLRQLLKFNRYFSLIDIASHFVEEVPTDLLMEILTNAATKPASEPTNVRGYEVERIFASIDQRKDVESHALVNLEWLYMPILSSYGSRRKPKNLHDELSRNPTFFMEIIKWIYKPKDETKLQAEVEDITDEARYNRASMAYNLLHSWKKIPGLQSDDTIDELELKKWITDARTLAEQAGRLEVADIHIGQVLAQFPERAEAWPNEIIFRQIESINSDVINRNYGAALFNKRGSSTRGPFDGGDIERGHAADFTKLANDYKTKYPIVYKIFRQLADGYLSDAKRQDEQAQREQLEY